MKSFLCTWFLVVFCQTTSGFLFMWNCTYSAECVRWAVILHDSFDLDILSLAWVMLEAHGVQLPGTCIPWQENPNQSCLHATWRKRRKGTFFLGGGESTHLSAGLTYFLENNLRVSSLRPSCDVFWSYWLLPQSISDATAFLTLSTVYSFLHFWLIQGTHYSYDLKDVYSLTCDGWWIYSWLNFKWIWFYWN